MVTIRGGGELLLQELVSVSLVQRCLLLPHLLYRVVLRGSCLDRQTYSATAIVLYLMGDFLRRNFASYPLSGRALGVRSAWALHQPDTISVPCQHAAVMRTGIVAARQQAQPQRYLCKAAARFASSSGETSSWCVAIHHRLPTGSCTPALRSP